MSPGRHSSRRIATFNSAPLVLMSLKKRDHETCYARPRASPNTTHNHHRKNEFLSRRLRDFDQQQVTSRLKLRFTLVVYEPGNVLSGGCSTPFCSPASNASGDEANGAPVSRPQQPRSFLLRNPALVASTVRLKLDKYPTDVAYYLINLNIDATVRHSDRSELNINIISFDSSPFAQRASTRASVFRRDAR